MEISRNLNDRIIITLWIVEGAWLSMVLLDTVTSSSVEVPLGLVADVFYYKPHGQVVPGVYKSMV